MLAEAGLPGRAGSDWLDRRGADRRHQRVTDAALLRRVSSGRLNVGLQWQACAVGDRDLCVCVKVSWNVPAGGADFEDQGLHRRWCWC